MASIYQRGDIYWIVYYQDGKKIQESLKTKDKTVAKYKKNDLENKLALGDSPLPSNASVIEAQNKYREDSKHRKTWKTVRDDDARITSFLNWSKITQLSQINEQPISEYIQSRLDAEQIGLVTANAVIKTMKAFLNFTVQRRMLSKNPIREMKRYKVDKKPPKFLHKAGIDKILKNCEGHYLYPMVMIALYTGVRYGELQRIAWKDVNLKTGTITIPKSKSGQFRVIPIHSALKPVLKPGNLPVEQMETSAAIKRLRYQTKRNDIGWHTFRHTFASHLVMSGVDIVTVSKLLGHSKLETTMIYAHLSQPHVKESINRLHF